MACGLVVPSCGAGSWDAGDVCIVACQRALAHRRAGTAKPTPRGADTDTVERDVVRCALLYFVRTREVCTPGRYCRARRAVYGGGCRVAQARAARRASREVIKYLTRHIKYFCSRSTLRSSSCRWPSFRTAVRDLARSRSVVRRHLHSSETVSDLSPVRAARPRRQVDLGALAHDHAGGPLHAWRSTRMTLNIRFRVVALHVNLRAVWLVLMLEPALARH